MPSPGVGVLSYWSIAGRKGAMTSDYAHPTVIRNRAMVRERFESGEAVPDPADRLKSALRWADIAGTLTDTAETPADHLTAARARHRLAREVNDLEAAQQAWSDILEWEGRAAAVKSPAFAEDIARAADRAVNDGQPRRVPKRKYGAVGVGDDRGEGVVRRRGGWSGRPAAGAAKEAAEPW